MSHVQYSDKKISENINPFYLRASKDLLKIKILSKPKKLKVISYI